MIILNQNKNMIIDTTKIYKIFIDTYHQRPLKYAIYARGGSGDLIRLGEYGTSKEEAIKVLKEIFDRIGNWENLKHGQPSGICTPTYEMPKIKEENQDA